MATKRRPATAEEVQEFFQTEPLETAQLMVRLVTSAVKKREPAKPKAARKPAPTISSIAGEQHSQHVTDEGR